MEKIKKLLKDGAAEATILRQLKNNPERLAIKYGLNDSHLRALKSANLLIVDGHKPTSAVTYTFNTASTVTA
jgi:hypothetical protein